MTEAKYIYTGDRLHIDLSSPKSNIEPGELQPKVELEKLTVITEDDVNNAISEWKNDPPEDEYKTLLEAEEVD